MGALDFLRRKQQPVTIGGVAEVQTTTLSDGSFFTYLNLNQADAPEKLTQHNGYHIAKSLSEVYFPIDTIAEKVSKLFSEVTMVNSLGREIKMPGSLRRLFDKPNVYTQSFADLIYNYVFSELSDGNGYMYFKTPEGTKAITKDNVQQLYYLQPDMVKIELLTDERSRHRAQKIADYIKHYEYTLTDEYINPMFILHSKSGVSDRSSTDFRALSPLWAARRNVDNLLACYSARYNVYVNNGTAFILFPQRAAANDLSAALDPNKRDDIISDLNNRYGLTGDRQIKAVSNAPLGGLNTLVSIKDLMPFDETVMDALAIAGVYGVDKDLLPLKDGTTFTNKEVAEAKIWNDIAITYADDILTDLNNMFNLSPNERLAINTSGVGFLQKQRVEEMQADNTMLSNIKLMMEMGVDVSGLIEKIKQRYEQD